MKKIFLTFCIISLMLISGCTSMQKTPSEQFKEIFDQTPNEELFLWIPDLERIDLICQDANKQFDIEVAAKIKNDVPLSKYDDEKTPLRKKTEELLEQLQLKETEQFTRYRILLRIGCEQEEKNYLVIYDDMKAKIIHIDKNYHVDEKYYEVESVSAVEDLLEYIDSLYE